MEKIIVLSESDANYLAGILLEHMSNYVKEVPNSILKLDIELYNKLFYEGNNLTLDYVKKYIVK